jgi:hypothetical protein
MFPLTQAPRNLPEDEVVALPLGAEVGAVLLLVARAAKAVRVVPAMPAQAMKKTTKKARKRRTREAKEAALQTQPERAEPLATRRPQARARAARRAPSPTTTLALQTPRALT